ncbi:MAG: MarR family winged helix-turn-helix transcriptional regulator [Enterococcus italicus]
MDLRAVSKLLYQLKLATQETMTKFERETGFSITRYELLLFLQEQGECTQTVLQNELQIDSAAVTRHLKLLEEKGYVVRKRNSENNREVFVKPTSKALTDLTTCQNEHEQTQANLLPLDDQEGAALLELLTKLVK